MANVLKCLTNVLWTLVNHSKIQNQAYPQIFSWYWSKCSDYFYHGFNGLDGLCPARCKTKTGKTPCVGSKMSLTSHWCCACLKILKQAWIFSVSYIITLQGLCIHRKAINKNKPSYPLNGILLQERLPHARQNGLLLFIALERMVAFILMKVLICFWFGC